MNGQKKLYQTSKLVQAILEQDEQARNIEGFLYLKVIREIGESKGIDVENMKVPYFLLHMNELGFPPFKSVDRARRKLQATFPELAANDEVKKKRKENERVYKAYAQSKAIKIGDKRNEENNSNDFSINNIDNDNRLWGELGTN